MGRQSDKNAPKKAPSGFILFTKDRRASSEDLVNKSFAERNRILGTEWNALSAAEKQVYLDQAALQREQYKVAWEEYRKTDAYKQWVMSTGNKNKKSIKSKGKEGRKRGDARRHGKENNATSESIYGNLPPECKISIFTTDFLKFNRLREANLRQLKKQATQLEEETALQGKHVDNLVSAESRIKVQLQASQELLVKDEQLLRQLCKELTSTFSEVTLPCSSSPSNTYSIEHITETSVEPFLSHLSQLCAKKENPDLVRQIEETLQRVSEGSKLISLHRKKEECVT